MSVDLPTLGRPTIAIRSGLALALLEDETGERLQERRFARTVWADEGVHRATLDGKRNAAHRQHATVRLGQAVDDKRRTGGKAC